MKPVGGTAVATSEITRRGCLVVLIAGCIAGAVRCHAADAAAGAAGDPRPVPPPPAVFAAYLTPVAEPWNAVIHAALGAAERGGRIRYAWRDGLDTVEKRMAAIETAIAEKVALVVADAADAEDEILALARQHPGTAFLVGGPDGPQEPNVSTFASTLAEPAYLCGLMAGRLTKSGVVGVVAGRHDASVHRTVNGFLQGARDANPAVKTRVTFTDAWFDPPRARKAALDMIAAGADVLFAEREGAIAAARETGALAFGSMLDQHDEGPDTVVSGAVWSMEPALEHVLSRLAAGTIPAENLGRFATLARGGAVLAPWHGWERKIPPDVLRLVEEKREAIVAGTLRIEVTAEPPPAE